MSIETLKDDSLVDFYENIRRHVDLDRPFRVRLTSNPSIRKYADSLRAEIDRRRLRTPLIEWPEDP
jgi:hypothetical protein